MKRFEGTSTSSIAIAVHHTGADAIVHLKGHIDVDSSPDVRDRLRAILLTDPSPHTVTVDLTSVTSIEASGIATLVEALKVARQHDIRFQIQSSGSVLELFESTGLLRLFDAATGGKGAS